MPNPALTTTTTKRPIYPTKSPIGPTSPTTVDPSKGKDDAPTTDEPEKPNTCDTSYDAISVIRQETFIFKGKYFWRINSDGKVDSYPIDRFWYGLPANLTHIDAIYEKKSGQNEIVIFIGN